MIRSVLSLYRPKFAKTIVYMLQATEYDVGAYLQWLGRVTDFRKVMYRRELRMTRPAKMLLAFVSLGMLIQLVGSIVWLIFQVGDPVSWQLTAAIILLASTPLVWMLLAVVPLLAGRWFIVQPLNKTRVRKSRGAFTAHKSLKIAVAGSYGV